MMLAIVLLGGMLFGCGLALSGMTKPEVVLSFLHLEDFGLMLVMGGGIAVTMASIQLGRRAFAKPWVGVFENWGAKLNRRTLLGAVVFGAGWGISGLCPGSALASLGTGNTEILLALGAMFAGAYAQARWFPES
jgi:uncharacterized protein